MVSSPRPKYILNHIELARLLSLTPKQLLGKLNASQLVTLERDLYGVPREQVRDLFLDKGASYAFRVISHLNLKGGVGKTTATINVASRAVQLGFRTVVIDMDAQGSASMAFNLIPEKNQPIFLDVWSKPGEMIAPALKRIDEDLYLLPSGLENGLLDSALANPRHQKVAVHNVCQVLSEMNFDLILLDCPPSLGTAVISSICASDTIVVPVGSDPFSFRGLDLALEEITAIRETYALPAPEIKVLFARYDRRENLAKVALEKLAGPYREYALPVHIRTSTEVSKALKHHSTVFARNTREGVREDYAAYTQYLLKLPI